ncbi:hypothetical protein U1Q18_007292 [Sarracenia purpurea var. burkii]
MAVDPNRGQRRVCLAFEKIKSQTRGDFGADRREGLRRNLTAAKLQARTSGLGHEDRQRRSRCMRFKKPATESDVKEDFGTWL